MKNPKKFNVLGNFTSNMEFHDTDHISLCMNLEFDRPGRVADQI